LKYYLSFRNFEQLSLALKTDFALKFFKTGDRPPLPAPPRRMSMPLRKPGWIGLCQFLWEWSI